MVGDYRDMDRFEPISPDELEEILRSYDFLEELRDPLALGAFAAKHFERLVADLDRHQRREAALRAALTPAAANGGTTPPMQVRT